MAIYVANNGQLQTIKGIYYGMTEDYINANLFHNLVPKTATEIRFLYALDNPDLTNYQRIGYADNNNFIEVWKKGTMYVLVNPQNNDMYAPVSCFNFFDNYQSLINCVFDNFNTRDVTNMRGLFYRCSNLATLDLSNFNTEKVTNMSQMFNGCVSLTTLDLRSFNTQNVTSMRAMFHVCNRIISIISNSFNTRVLSDSALMFYNCSSLVGGNGTTYSSSHITAEYARVDGENGLAGYFTAPTN